MDPTGLYVSLPGLADAVWLYIAIFLAAVLATGGALGVYFSRTETRTESTVTGREVVDAIADPVAVVDANGEILMANVAFRSLFDRDPAGKPVEAVVGNHDDLVAAIDSDDDERTVTLGTDQPRHLEVRTFPLGEGIHEDQQRLLFVRDVTGREEQRLELERQNERLEEFASIISHDLRNPLDVAIGRTNAVKEHLSDPELRDHLERAGAAHGRMERIIADVLTIARNGDTVDETEEISLEATARAAWEYVDTGLATLAVETDRTVEADEDRLVRMFENLFRNAVEHGGEDVTVRVQTHPEGFVVSDDGPGIAPAEREMVFEAGYSGDDGTGLGLAIVHKIALAHGWDVTVAESDAGGARFEFVDIESVAEEPKAKEQT